MLTTRKATVEDAGLITRHRKAMFAGMRDAAESVLAEMARHFDAWVRRMISEDKYVGWIISDGDRAIASTGLLVLDWAPHYLDPTGEHRGYILNVFVEPEYRRRGLALEPTKSAWRRLDAEACTWWLYMRRRKGNPFTRGWGSRSATRCCTPS